MKKPRSRRDSCLQISAFMGISDLRPQKVGEKERGELHSVRVFLFVCVCMGCINITLQVFKWLCGVLYLEEAWLNLLSPHLCG